MPTLTISWSVGPLICRVLARHFYARAWTKFYLSWAVYMISFWLFNLICSIDKLFLNFPRGLFGRPRVDQINRERVKTRCRQIEELFFFFKR